MVTRWGKLWIATTVIALFLWILRWIYGNIITTYSMLVSPTPFGNYAEWRFWVDRVLTGLIGNGIRLSGSILALLVMFLIWKAKPMSFASIKRKVSGALICEGVYWLLVLPISIIELFYLERAPFVEIALIIQIFLTGPLLIVLAAKIWNYTETNKMNTLKWAGIAAIGYLVGTWCNDVFRWFSMAQVTAIGFLLTGKTGLGFLGALITLTVSLVFAVLSFYAMFNKQNLRLSVKMAGVSLVFLGFNFVIYILYSALTNSLSFVFLVEFWPIPVLGLGLGMLRGKT